MRKPRFIGDIISLRSDYRGEINLIYYLRVYKIINPKMFKEKGENKGFVRLSKFATYTKISSNSEKHQGGFKKNEG